MIIADQVLPLYSAGELDASMVNRLFEYASQHPSAVQAFPELLRVSPESEAGTIQAILDTMPAAEPRDAWCGFNAVYRWLKSWQSGTLHPIPRLLIDGLLWIIDTRSESARLHALIDAPHLVKSGTFEKADCARLSHALSRIFTETAYENAKYSTSLTLLRASCMRLASALKATGEESTGIQSWLELDKNDRQKELRTSRAKARISSV